MEIIFCRKFEKQYKKLNTNQQNLVHEAISLFMDNPNHPKLRNHTLTGKLKGVKSIDVAFDLRILFTEEGNYTKVFILKVGSHSQLYR